MAELFRSCGISLDQDRLSRFWTYHQLLREYNPVLNLTRIHNFDNMVLKLYVDSALPARLTDLPSPLLDMGTGPGMPGIPLKIMRPDLQMLLAESRQNRVTFLETAVKRLGFSAVEVVGQAVGPAFQTPVPAVITRAVAAIPDILDRIQGCLEQDGLAIFMKGPDCDAEIETATREMVSRFKLVENIAYRIGNTPNQRRLVIFRRIDRPAFAVRDAAMKRHTTRTVESPQNAVFKDLKKLLSGRGIKKAAAALVSGDKQIAEILTRFPKRCRAWITSGDASPPPEGTPDSLEWIQLSDDLFRQLDIFGTRYPLLHVRIPQMPTWRPEEGFETGCTLLIPFQDPENVGAVIRSAVAFDVSRIILLAESAHPFHPKAIRASGGAVFAADFRTGPSIHDLNATAPILPLSGEGTPIDCAAFPDAFGLMPGIEGPGLPDRFRVTAVSIPISDAVESLNAAVATAIALFEWRRKMGP